MKVICIDDTPLNPEAPWLIKEREVYEVLRVFTQYELVWYELDIQPGIAYQSKYFIPISSIDETKMVREYNTAKV